MSSVTNDRVMLEGAGQAGHAIVADGPIFGLDKLNNIYNIYGINNRRKL